MKLVLLGLLLIAAAVVGLILAAAHLDEDLKKIERLGK